MYKVIKFFTDLQDGRHPYNVGDEYPRKGLEVSEARIAELAGKANRQKTPLIEEVRESESEAIITPKEVASQATNNPTEVQSVTETPKRGRKKKEQ